MKFGHFVDSYVEKYLLVSVIEPLSSFQLFSWCDLYWLYYSWLRIFFSINSSVWKERAAALESIQTLLATSQNIKPELGGDFIAGLKVTIFCHN